MEQSAWEALKKIAKEESLNAQRPNVGRRVRVIATPCSGPRSKAFKLLGIEGTVTWHGVDRFSGAWTAAAHTARFPRFQRQLLANRKAARDRRDPKTV